MNEAERDKIISDINRDSSASTENKQERIARVNQTFLEAQSNAVAANDKRRESAEAELKSNLKTAYMENPAATEADFEKDYPEMRSRHLQDEAISRDAYARRSQAAATREAF